MFNIYYLNYSKAFEIAMLKDNEIIESKEERTSQNKQDGSTKSLEGEVNTSLGNTLLGRIQAALKGNVELKSEEGSVQSINHNIRVIHSNSILLNSILRIAVDTELKKLNEKTEGELIKLDKLQLYILNEENVRAAKAMRPGSIRDIDGFKVEGMSLNADKLLNSMLSDYFYLLCCNITNKEGLFFKIPLNDEFQSSYSVDDLLIGNISLVGVYKGVVNRNDLTNTFDFFQNVGENTKEEKQYENSSYSEKDLEKTGKDLINNNIEKFHFVDTIAVLQDIKIKSEDTGDE
ncbi:hypothetical protein SAMN04488569_101224 [Marinilactibacillus piezotolerans]|uniref:Uncharacterized protein n=1 Tax=Marinilactibacillus piezotolerans TaxID=258723 RepID=A0A1I3X4M9_9LACT|nr:hypothetical protein [Marinilactibacillus piezotolerans]SFK14514.1 hypothetical protein SAMN04488569_101224 [Marinilactibacillus piezotolerans]